MRWILAVLLAGVTVTACSSAIAGHGRSPGLVAAVRVPRQTPVGDPVTVDLCAGVPPAALSRWGEPAVHWYQSAGRCYYDVIVDGSTAFQIDTDQLPRSSYHPQLKGRPGRNGVLAVWVYAPTADGCERAFQVGRFVFELFSFALQGAVGSKTLCAGGTAMARAEMRAVSATSVLPRRPLPDDTFTRFDLCRLMAGARLTRVSGLADLAPPEPIDAGGSCRADGLSTTVDAEVAFIDTRAGTPAGRDVTLRGHALEVDSEPGDEVCYVDAARNFVLGSSVREYLSVRLSSSRLADKRRCAAAENVAADLLDAAGER